MKTSRRQLRRGFTLTEILVAMAIFALGGSAIVALFITNARLSRQAMDYTRSAEITRNVRSLLTQSLSRPIPVDKTVSVYKFDYPGSSLTFRPSQYLKDVEERRQAAPDNLGGTPVENSIFFRLPTQRFDARVRGEEAQRNMVTWLPNNATDIGGVVRYSTNRPEVFRLLPDELRRSGAVDSLDPDDRMFYSFDFTIRRSVARSSAEDPTNPGAKLALEDLFVVHLKIYKGYTFREEAGGAEVITDPIYEWDFYVTAAR